MTTIRPKCPRCALFAIAAVLLFSQAPVFADDPEPVALRPPAVPLVTIDPFTSCWSMADHLYDDWPKHWTGKPHSLCGLIRIDGRTRRFMGVPAGIDTVMEQVALEVYATRTVYTFSDGAVELKVTFTSPLLPHDLALLSRPASYVAFASRSIDGEPHDVAVYFDATAEWAVNRVDQEVLWKRLTVSGLEAMAVGTRDQKVLASKGDDHRIDWGYLLVAAPGEKARTVMGSVETNRAAFAASGAFAGGDDTGMPRAANDRWPGLCVLFDLPAVGDDPVERHLIVGYDDVWSIEYFHRPLRAWWRRDPAMTAEKMLAAAEKDYPAVIARCREFDGRLSHDALKAGGRLYADLCTVVFRQVMAAHKLVADEEGRPLFFSKENNSNGSIGTVDVTYPSAPLFLVYNAELVKGMLEPIFHYRESGRWIKPIAAHDVGTYPIANGQTYPRDMPVEECGNMIILTAAIADVEGDASYARTHWEALTEWARYLEEKGFDPENQLCTDDFAGHLARNANLSIKAIVALGCYGRLAAGLGDADLAGRYSGLARKLALEWVAAAGDGDHFSLTFDGGGTWSQKYNLVWDRLLGLNLFPEDVAGREIAFYLTKQNRYGLPLDSRRSFTKSDWIMWTAALAERQEDFLRLIGPVWDYVNESPGRVPVSDWHETTTGKHIAMYARSVVGGYFMKMLTAPGVEKTCTANFDWKAHKATSLPRRRILVPSSEEVPQAWRYTLENPSEDWFAPDFDDTGWRTGMGAFGNRHAPRARFNTEWTSSGIWLRRVFPLADAPSLPLYLYLRHDEDVEVYINGRRVLQRRGWVDNYISVPIEGLIDGLFVAGENTLAVHCRQTSGGQYIDVGIDVHE
jgi:hypothetical protein